MKHTLILLLVSCALFKQAASQVKVVEEDMRAVTFDNKQFLDSLLLNKSACRNFVLDAPFIRMYEIATDTFVKRMQSFFGEENYKIISRMMSGSISYWKNAPNDSLYTMKEPWVDNFFYSRDSLYKAGKIKTMCLSCIYAPVCFKVKKKHYAIILFATLTPNYKTNIFGQQSSIMLYEWQRGHWHLVKNL